MTRAAAAATHARWRCSFHQSYTWLTRRATCSVIVYSALSAPPQPRAPMPTTVPVPGSTDHHADAASLPGLAGEPAPRERPVAPAGAAGATTTRPARSASTTRALASADSLAV